MLLRWIRVANWHFEMPKKSNLPYLKVVRQQKLWLCIFAFLSPRAYSYSAVLRLPREFGAFILEYDPPPPKKNIRVTLADWLNDRQLIINWMLLLLVGKLCRLITG